MAVRIWLHEDIGDEPGWEAWGLDFLGFATWAFTKDEVLERVPTKLEEYLGWLDKHGLSQPNPGPGIEVVEHVVGNEVLFAVDRYPATADEIDQTIRLIKFSRCNLLATIEPLSDEVLDWDPPYWNFAVWADWRTIRANLAHIANTETHYYLRHIGYEPTMPPVRPNDDWRSFLTQSRAEAIAYLERQKSSVDRARVKEDKSEHWSVRKALRRMVRHELLHWKSIQRIVREYNANYGSGTTAD